MAPHIGADILQAPMPDAEDPAYKWASRHLTFKAVRYWLCIEGISISDALEVVRAYFKGLAGKKSHACLREQLAEPAPRAFWFVVVTVLVTASSIGWQPVPVTCRKDWRRRPDLNRRMEVLQTSALPLGYGALSGSTTKPRVSGREKVERETGFEPATSTLARSHSTTELFPLANRLSTLAQPGALTQDNAVASLEPPPRQAVDRLVVAIE